MSFIENKYVEGYIEIASEALPMCFNNNFYWIKETIMKLKLT